MKIFFVKGRDGIAGRKLEGSGKIHLVERAYAGPLPKIGETWECQVLFDTKPNDPARGAIIVRPLRKESIRAEEVSIRGPTSEEWVFLAVSPSGEKTKALLLPDSSKLIGETKEEVIFSFFWSVPEWGLTVERKRSFSLPAFYLEERDELGKGPESTTLAWWIGSSTVIGDHSDFPDPEMILGARLLRGVKIAPQLLESWNYVREVWHLTGFLRDSAAAQETELEFRVCRFRETEDPGGPITRALLPHMINPPKRVSIPLSPNVEVTWCNTEGYQYEVVCKKEGTLEGPFPESQRPLTANELVAVRGEMKRQVKVLVVGLRGAATAPLRGFEEKAEVATLINPFFEGVVSGRGFGWTRGYRTERNARFDLSQEIKRQFVRVALDYAALNKRRQELNALADELQKLL